MISSPLAMTAPTPERPPNGHESPAKWVSVAQASAALNVSEKTLLRRIKAGQIEARKEPLAAGGMAWRVHLDLSAMDIGLDNAPEPQRTKTERAGTVPEGERTKNRRDGHAKDSAMDKAPEVSIARAGTAKDTQRTEENDDLLAHLKEENRFFEARSRKATGIRQNSARHFGKHLKRRQRRFPKARRPRQSRQFRPQFHWMSQHPPAWLKRLKSPSNATRGHCGNLF